MLARLIAVFWFQQFLQNTQHLLVMNAVVDEYLSTIFEPLKQVL